MVNGRDPSLFATVEHLRHVNIDLILKVVKYHEIMKETNGFAPPTTLYFDEHVRHGKTIIGLAWEMYIESFLDPTLALKNIDTTEGLT
ncbi:hypothetical protein Tco_0789403 [Tanacetum coccineum]